MVNQKLGQILLNTNKINLIHLSMALDVQRFQDLALGEILKELKVLSEAQLVEALTLQKNLQS